MIIIIVIVEVVEVGSNAHRQQGRGCVTAMPVHAYTMWPHSAVLCCPVLCCAVLCGSTAPPAGNKKPQTTGYSFHP